MSMTLEEDVWQIDPVTARVRPDASMPNPALVVVERGAGLSRSVADICDFLQIAVIVVNDPRDIPEVIGEVQPIAVIQEADGIDYTIYDLLMVVAGYDPGMPVMVIMPEEPQNKGALEAAQRLWQLSEVIHMPQRPGVRAFIDFLFRAGRRFGRTRFMPV